MTVTVDELRAYVTNYQAQHQQAAHELQKLEQAYQHQKQELTTTLAMCAGAVQAFEGLIGSLEQGLLEKDTIDGDQ